MSNLLICSQRDHRIFGLVCDTLWDPARDLHAMSTNSQDLQKWSFSFAGPLDVVSPFLVKKNMFLIVLPVVHGQSKGCL